MTKPLSTDAIATPSPNGGYPRCVLTVQLRGFGYGAERPHRLEVLGGAALIEHAD
jgi:hypothetical protein